MSKKYVDIETIITTSSQLDDVICNRCRKSCRRYCAPTQIVSQFEYADLSADWGYFSKKDGEAHRAHLCESCYDEVLKIAGIEPEITETFKGVYVRAWKWAAC